MDPIAFPSHPPRRFIPSIPLFISAFSAPEDEDAAPNVGRLKRGKSERERRRQKTPLLDK
jgi:hypothetical protein